MALTPCQLMEGAEVAEQTPGRIPLLPSPHAQISDGQPNRGNDDQGDGRDGSDTRPAERPIARLRRRWLRRERDDCQHLPGVDHESASTVTASAFAGKTPRAAAGGSLPA